MYDSRICRWLSIDPAGQYASSYEGTGNNPIANVNPTGGVDGDPVTLTSTSSGYVFSDITITAKAVDHTGIGQSFINGFADPFANMIVSLMHR